MLSALSITKIQSQHSSYKVKHTPATATTPRLRNFSSPSFSTPFTPTSTLFSPSLFILFKRSVESGRMSGLINAKRDGGGNNERKARARETRRNWIICLSPTLRVYFVFTFNRRRGKRTRRGLDCAESFNKRRERVRLLKGGGRVDWSKVKSGGVVLMVVPVGIL